MMDAVSESLTQARERIWRLAVSNPIVHRAVHLWRRGVVSWEEALILMVEAMDKAHQSMQEKMTEATWESLGRGFIAVEPDQTYGADAG